MPRPLWAQSSAAPAISHRWNVALPGRRTPCVSLEGNLLYGGCAPVSTMSLEVGPDLGDWDTGTVALCHRCGRVASFLRLRQSGYGNADLEGQS
jgi:hypothetical protein